MRGLSFEEQLAHVQQFVRELEERGAPKYIEKTFHKIANTNRLSFYEGNRHQRRKQAALERRAR